MQGQKAGEPSRNSVYAGRISGRDLDLGGIASLFSIAAGVPVVDRTGLTGTFDIDVTYAPEGSSDSNLPAFFTAIEEQLGLKLKAQKVIVDTLVIDHVDDQPTPN